MAQSWLHSARTVARSAGLSASSQVQRVRNRAMGCGERGTRTPSLPESKRSPRRDPRRDSPSREFVGLESKSS